MMDKEHFNTLELLKNKNNDFYYHGHNRVYQYFLTIIVALISLKIILLFVSKKNAFKYYSIMFLAVLIIQVINSYLIYLLNNYSIFSLFHYYFINLTLLSIFCYMTLKHNENK